MPNDVTVVTENGNETVVVPKEIIHRIKLLENMTTLTQPNGNETEENFTFPLNNVPASHLEYFIKVLNSHNFPIDIRWFDYNQLENVLKDPNVCINDLINSANFLECNEMIDLLLMYVAKRYAGVVKENLSSDLSGDDEINEQERKHKLLKDLEDILNTTGVIDN